MKLSNKTLQKIKHKVIYDLLMRQTAKLLNRIGLAIRFYYVFKEGLPDGEKKDFCLESQNYEIAFLDSEDVAMLDPLEGHDATVSDMQTQISQGHKCLGLKNNGKIVGFTWCRFDQFVDYPPTKGFKLEKNEAYLYDMYILQDYRGSDLAPFLRYKCYQELAKIGRTVLYSVSLIPNAPAIRFKKKIGAQILSLGLHVQLRKNICWNWKLRTYKQRKSK